MNINFLIPTKNEQPELLRDCIASINSFGATSKYTYDINVCSPKEVAGLNVVWHEDKFLRGPLHAFNYLFKNTDGEYVICLVEDHQFVSPFDNAIDFLINEYSMNTYKICSLSTNDGFPCGLPRRGQRLGSILNLQEDLPNCQICRFPVAARETVNKYLNSYIFHPEFRYHAGDIYLGYYLYMMGEQSRECYTARLKQTQFSKNAEWECSDCNIAYALIKNFQYGCQDYVNEPDSNLSKSRYSF